MTGFRPVVVTLLLVFVVAASAGASRLLDLAPNPSFEQGDAAPAGWTPQPGAAGDVLTWAAWLPRFGRRSLAIESEGGAAWESDPVGVRPHQAYRLSGWIAAREGEGRLEIVFLDGQGAEVARACTPAASAFAWTYVAVEADLAGAPGRAVSARITCRAQGAARFDGIALTPLRRSLLRNGDFEQPPPKVPDEDLQARLNAQAQGWQRVVGRCPEGALQWPEGKGRGGGRCLALAGRPKGTQAASYFVDLPEGKAPCVFEGWAKAPADGTASVILAWHGDRGWISDMTAHFPRFGSQWTGLTVEAAPPLGADRVRVICVATSPGSAVLFDDLALTPRAAGRREVRAFVNQVGWDPADRKRAIVATSFFPDDLKAARFSVVDEAGHNSRAGRLRPVGRVHEGYSDDWGSYYWQADLSPLARAGRYRLVAEADGVEARSPEFEIAPRVALERTGELAYRLYYVQRCGVEVPGWHGACHMDDARLPDGSHLDVTGGWHDAGDYNKWMYPEGPLLAVYALGSAYEAHPEFFDAMDRDGNGRPDVLDEMLWGAEFLCKMRRPEGGLYGSVTTGWSYWGAPGMETDGIAGTPDDRPIKDEHPAAEFAAAGLAMGARLLPQTRERFLPAAEALYEDQKKRGEHAQDMLPAEIELHRATGEAAYLDAARRHAAAIAAGLPGAWQTQRHLAALAAFVLAFPDDPQAEAYRRALESALAARREAFENAFGVIPTVLPSEQDRAAGYEGRFFKPEGWGGNWGVLDSAWAAMACARATGDARWRAAALDALDWVLGVNPLGLCMMEGAGTINPPLYHHRYMDMPAHRRGAVPGAIPNGIGLDRAFPQEDRPCFATETRPALTTEPWIPYSAFYLMMLSML